MILHELYHRSSHYLFLLIVESIVFSLFILTDSTIYRDVLALFCGVFYMGWGVYTHSGELITSRLIFEYVAIGTLASCILLLLSHAV